VILGFPFAIFFAWAFELTPEGLKKEKDVDRSQSITPVTGRKLDFIIIGMLAVALAYFIWASQVQESIPPDEPAAMSQTVSRLADLVELPEMAGPSIAVLPFVNMSSDVEQEYFSDGLSEELLNLLSKIPHLRVASRTSAFSYKGKDIKIPQIGRELNVGHVLEGSVRKSGTKIRITAQLIDVENDTHLWSETWDRTLDDIFAIQDEIAKVVVDQLKVELLGDVPRAAETSPEAYALILQARHHTRRRSVEGYATAESLLHRATEIDPEYAPAWALLAYTFQRSGSIDARTPRESARLSLDAANKALALDPRNTLAIGTLASVEAYLNYDYPAATEYVERALRINPGDIDALLTVSGFAFLLGDYETAMRLSRKVIERDPLSTFAYINFAYSAFFEGEYYEATAALEKLIELNPDTAGAHYYISLMLLEKGQTEAALERIQLENLDGFRNTGLAIIHDALGDKAASDAELASLNELNIDWAYQRVIVYAMRGEIDKAFEWIETAIEIRDRGLNLILGDPMVDNLRDDPRFADVLKRLNRTAVR
jgi:TolB-like protein/Tfp pilus assembly protein PilF